MKKHLAIIFPALCLTIMAIISACNGTVFGFLPNLVVLCDGLDAAHCNTSGTDGAILRAYIKPSDATCDGTDTDSVAFGRNPVDCATALGMCVTDVATWRDEEGGSVLLGIPAGNYVADSYIDSDGGDTLTVGEPVSCTEFNLDFGEIIVVADEWTNFV